MPLVRPPLAQDVQAAFAATLVDEWVRAGVTDVVVCPGSRSTPLLIAVAEAAEQGALRAHSVLDERSAAYFALGLGLASGMPAPVVTTSGTAAVELHPAVVEAHHAGVPMLAVTADRPPELQDCGAPQTVHQVGLYGDAVRWEAAPGVPGPEAAATWRSLAARSVAEARGGARRPGPVHLNLAFREPLIGSAGAFASTPEGRAGGAPWHRVGRRQDLVAPMEVVDLLAGAGERGLIVAGAGSGSPDAVWQLARAAGWPVLASPPSGCRLPGAVSAADALLRGPLAAWRPEVVLRLGAPWASRAVNEWLESLACPQVLVDPWGAWAAPDRRPAEVVVASPEALCRAVAAAVPPGRQGAWATAWAEADERAQGAIDKALAAEAGMTEPGVARWLLGAVPDGGSVVVSSSMPVRDVESWSRAGPGPSAGEPGRQRHRRSAFHGIRGSRRRLSWGRRRPFGRPGLPVRRRRAPGRRGRRARPRPGRGRRGQPRRGYLQLPEPGRVQPPERFERMWGTPQGADIAAVARAYGAHAEEVADMGGLASALDGHGPGTGVRVFVVKTDRAENVAVHRRLYAAVEAAVRGLVL